VGEEGGYMVFAIICIIFLITFFLWALVSSGRERREAERREELKNMFQQNDKLN